MRVARVWLVVAFLLAVAAEAGLCGMIASIKANCKDGDVVWAEGIVTAEFPDCIYIEDEDRLAGIRVRGFGGFEGLFYIFDSNGATAGMLVSTGSDGEKELTWLGGPVAVIPSAVPRPLFFINRCLGGGDFHYDSLTGRGQRGSCGGCGVNNIGLLVKTSGRVNEVNFDERWFYVDDGSLRCGGTGHTGVRVDYSDWPHGHPVVVGNYCQVTGICTVIVLDGKLHPVVKPLPFRPAGGMTMSRPNDYVAVYGVKGYSMGE